MSAGDIVPGDGLIQEAHDLFVDEGMLTGETFPAEKSESVLPAETPLAQRTNALRMGTRIVSGSARALIVRAGKETEFGKASERLILRPPETEFEHGIRRFGYFLLEITMVPVVAIFDVNVFLARPAIDSMLFSPAAGNLS
jgi:P-type Mg2+ transporter